MKYETEIFGHTIELRSNSTGSIDPWSLDYARSIDLSLMCTSDIGEFMLIDGRKIYKFQGFKDTYELAAFLSNDIFDSWEQFINEWLNPKLEKMYITDFGTIEDAKRNLDESKRRSIVWKSIPENEKRSIYEYLKTLSNEERDKWYESKFEEINESK